MNEDSKHEERRIGLFQSEKSAACLLFYSELFSYILMAFTNYFNFKLIWIECFRILLRHDNVSNLKGKKNSPLTNYIRWNEKCFMRFFLSNKKLQLILWINSFIS